MSFNRQVIAFNDQLLIIKRRIRESHLQSNYEVDVLKEWFRVDMILRKDGFLYLCETIQDAKIIETFSEKD
jgi:protein associated with RNAse G/E